LTDQGIHVTQYSPLGNLNPIYQTRHEPRTVDHPTIKEVASSESGFNESVPQATPLNPLQSEYNKTPSQVILSWGVAKGHSVVPKSSKPERIRENLQIFHLDPEDVEKIDKLNINMRYNDSSEEFGYLFFADEKDMATKTKQEAKILANRVVATAKEKIRK
jgi:alcohol dehydrogenase (NADP+)